MCGHAQQPNSPFARESNEGVLPALPGVPPGATGVNGPNALVLAGAELSWAMAKLGKEPQGQVSAVMKSL